MNCYFPRRMSQSEVFRPSNGDLIVRDTAGNDPAVSMDFLQRRPSTQGGYRFGQLSHNSFFTRHNPHPVRVRHIKGGEFVLKLYFKLFYLQYFYVVISGYRPLRDSG